MKLDKTKPYATVTGHPWAMYEQAGVLYDGGGDPGTDAYAAEQDDLTIPTDELESAKAFLQQVLAENPLSKSVVYKAAQTNNQTWEDVKAAADALGVVRFKYQNAEMWKLAAQE